MLLQYVNIFTQPWLRQNSVKTWVLRLIIFVLLTPYIFFACGVRAAADPLPDSEIVALNQWTNWVGNCGSDISNITDTSPTTASTTTVYMMGDSITAGAKSDLTKEFGNAKIQVSQIDGVGSRSFISRGSGSTNGLEAISKDTDNIKKSDTVIIALGTNGEDVPGKSTTFEKNANKALTNIKNINTRAKIYWVNIFSDSPPITHKAKYNKVISKLSGVQVIDMDKENIPLADGTHPTTAGYKKYAKALVGSLNVSSSSSASGSATATTAQAKKPNKTSKPSPGDKIKVGDVWKGPASTYGWDPVSGYKDPQDNNKPSLPGASNNNPGIAIYNHGTLGGWWRVTDPKGKTASLQQTDYGPSTNDYVDINAVAARSIWGYKPGNSFPTGQGKWTMEYLGKNKPVGAITKDTGGKGDAQAEQAAAAQTSDGSGQQGCCQSGGSSTDSNSSAGNVVDISKVVDKYKLQSVMIKEVGGSKIASYNEDKPPKTPASTMKLVIADTLLRSNISLNRTVPVTRDLYYAGKNYLNVSSITLKQALSRTLSESNNTGANVLMKALGGVNGFTQKAHGYGYTHTNVRGYYDPSNDGKNSSTISDQVNAMDHIFGSSSSDYQVAQSGLKTAAKSNNQYHVNDDANKWGGTSDVASNVGKFNIGGKDYIIGLYYNGSYTSSAAIKAMSSGSADLVQLITSAGSPGGSSVDGGGATQCCPSDGGAGVGDSTGSGSDKGTWNSGLKPPYILEQWAIETLKDLAKKKNKSQSDAVTKEHVVALVAFAMGEGGDINNSDLFNPLNTGIDAPDLVAGSHDASGVQSFKSFDAGVEAAARTFAKKQYSRLAAALLKPSSTAKQFMYALSYNWKYGAEWAGASNPSDPQYDPNYYSGRLDLVKQVRSNYKGTAGLVIGTSEKEQVQNKTEASKLQFDGSGSAGNTADSVCTGTSGDATTIAAEAVRLSWPDASHGATPTAAYKNAYNKYNSNGAGVADCGSFVATVMHASGADKNYPASGTAAQEEYVRKHPDKYDVVDKVSKISDLKPGDILIVNQGNGTNGNGHTFIYVGKQPPDGYDAASASQGTRAANLGKTILSDGRGNYMRARLK